MFLIRPLQIYIPSVHVGCILYICVVLDRNLINPQPGNVFNYKPCFKEHVLPENLAENKKPDFTYTYLQVFKKKLYLSIKPC